MKYLIFIFPWLICHPSYAQTVEELDQNNAHVFVSDAGLFFRDNIQAGYEIPAGAGNHMIYGMGFWMGALDESDQIHLAAQAYNSAEDLFPGPIANDYSSPYYLATYPSAVWKISKDQIQYHMSNYTATGYIPDPAIANWPGNGNVSEGIAEQLAPYVDANGDQIYDPTDGDYPYIQGDQAVYVIMNDAAQVHSNSGGQPLGMEIHVMFYQFDASDEVNNTTFMNVKVYNRSTITYHDFYFGLFLDYDLSYPSDDHIGCDSTRNLSYVYNGSDADFGIGSQPGFVSNAPAFGTILLNEPLGSFLYYNISGAINGDPDNASDHYNYLRARWKNGAHVLYGGDGCSIGTTGAESNFMFSGNPYTGDGWNEITEGNPPADRRGLMSSEPYDVAPGATVCFDYAFIYNRSGNNYLENVNGLLTTADYIQNFYTNNIQPCNTIFLDNSSPEEEVISIHPNPSNGHLSLKLSEEATITVFSLNGNIVQVVDCEAGLNEITLNLEDGMYLLQLKSQSGMLYQKIEILH